MQERRSLHLARMRWTMTAYMRRHLLRRQERRQGRLGGCGRGRALMALMRRSTIYGATKATKKQCKCPWGGASGAVMAAMSTALGSSITTSANAQNGVGLRTFSH